jgi:hypothetical protein
MSREFPHRYNSRAQKQCVLYVNLRNSENTYSVAYVQIWKRRLSTKFSKYTNAIHF